MPTKSSQQEVKPGEVMHTDLWGLAPVLGLKGQKYYILFVDEATQQTKIMYLSNKSEASKKVKHYLTWVEHQGKNLPKIIRVDNGREYVN